MVTISHYSTERLESVTNVKQHFARSGAGWVTLAHLLQLQYVLFTSWHYVVFLKSFDQAASFLP